jgi:cytochrome c553
MSRITTLVSATATLLIVLSPITRAADAANGQSLHDDNCVRCHDSQVYTRADRRVTSLQALDTQVRRCDSTLGTTWFDEDIADVVQYLNENYYKF